MPVFLPLATKKMNAKQGKTPILMEQIESASDALV